MQMLVDISELTKLADDSEEISKDVSKGIKNLVTDVTVDVHEQSVKNTRKGVLYPDGVYETGTLRSNIDFKITGAKRGKVFVNLNPVPYAKIVEEKKPYLQPSIAQRRRKIERLIDKFIRKFI